VTGVDGSEVFLGQVLNQTQQLSTVTQGTTLRFVALTGEHLLLCSPIPVPTRSSRRLRPSVAGAGVCKPWKAGTHSSPM
jgi:hypothetical protein